MVLHYRYLLLASLGLAVASGCSKKSKGGATSVDTDDPFDQTEASETTRFSKAVATGSLAITSIDVVGAAEKGKTSLALASTEFEEDGTNVQMSVYDPALDTIQNAGNILCFFNQANYIEMANQGPYVAQTDMNTCFKDNGDQSQNKSSGATKKVVNVIVDSARVDDFAPLIVKAWFEMVESRGPSNETFKVQMQVKMVVAEGQSEANPVGIFRLSWEGKVQGMAMMKGHIETSRSKEAGKINLVMIDANQQGPSPADLMLQKAAAQLDWDSGLQEVTGGRVRSSSPDWSMESSGGTPSVQEFAAAFNDSVYLRKNVTKNEQQCLSKNDFDFSVYRYGLYQAADGTRKELNSGFGITAQAQDGSTAHGYAGYWGLWLPENVTIADGMALTRREYGKADASYSVKTGPGKLIKYERAQITLDELDGVELSSGQDIIVYSKASGAFQKIGAYGEKGIVYQNIPEAFSIQPDWSLGREGSANFWSQALGGSVIVSYSSSGIALSPAAYFKQTNVTATQDNLTLYCLTNCMKTNVSQVEADGNPWSQSPSDPSPYSYFDWNAYFSAPNKASYLDFNKTSYAWDAASMSLTSGGLPVGLAAGVTNGGNNSWGYQSGPLVTALNGVDNPWDLNSASVYYMWETGSSSQNKFTRIIDAAGATVTFDAPLFFDYTHTQANDRSGLASGAGAKYYGKKLSLQYGGFGQLWGIPSEPDANNRWAPLFALKDGMSLGDNAEYKVRALDGEMRMRVVDATKCSALSVASLPALPSIETYKAPDLGPKPAGVEGSAPKVIEGVVVAK